MRAVVFDGQLHFTADAALRQARAGEVAVDVLEAGICETDLQLCQGYMGFQGILGHEFVGVARSGRYAGQRVVGEINCACHACSLCRSGLPTHCPSRSVVGILNHDGAFAETVLIPEANLHPVPPQISNSAAVFVEPVAAACRIPQQIPVAGRRAVVLGDGRLGNLCAQVLKHHNCDVQVVGKHPAKLELLQQLGIPTILLADLQPERVQEIVVDCTGSPTGLTTALQLVRPCGTVVLKTTVAASQSLHMAPFVIDEVTLLGSRCGPFDIALQLLQSGAVRVDPLISARYPLEDAATAFECAVRKDVLKVLLEVS
ncbi:MAG: 2-deoxy-scyllo-inosamine dehydrogenase [Planctomycetota bacterium]|jgi:threonine dehydrogenase-like Zn-dependent dehydrogenase